MRRLMSIARGRGLELMEGQVLSNNARMLDLARRLEFEVRNDPEENGVKIVEARLHQAG